MRVSSSCDHQAVQRTRCSRSRDAHTPPTLKYDHSDHIEASCESNPSLLLKYNPNLQLNQLIYRCQAESNEKRTKKKSNSVRYLLFLTVELELALLNFVVDLLIGLPPERWISLNTHIHKQFIYIIRINNISSKESAGYCAKCHNINCSKGYFMLPAKHNVHDNSERPDITLLIIRFLRKDFRSNVERRSNALRKLLRRTELR